ncbi:hypothetical protein [Actinomadura madurae]|uniref:hypothetical protein n=1 Tax=Actinomadura madurae TaxID=1993 RepID=UPI00202643A4|nr:hypothetical protein [Actinomadura madurae]MCP9968258.1 hypothetical protein [Actinomadura madurae]MCP9980720.1 hypothetical protein [Actinomadura madurae]MCQ0007772.1 hypothetical protein [Actinomadura madurae]URN07755.1 hypothetical protein LUW74_33265 [Actinomadura madurae]
MTALFRILTVTAVASGSLLAVQARAQATPFPETRLADNATHTYCIAGGGWSSARRTSVVWGMNRLANTTDMGAKYESACGPHTDVVWKVKNLEGAERGRTRCTRVNGPKCDSATIWMDFPQLAKGTDDWYDYRKTAVHEIGHTIGFDHHASGSHKCAMRSGEVPSRSIVWRSYTAHDRSHINKTY